MPGEGYVRNKDPRRSDERVVISEFKGMAPSQSPHAIDPGFSAFQVNCFAVHPGELRARMGLKPIVFSS